MSNEKINTFEVLNKINVSQKIEEKIGLKYLSWANAWGYLKEAYPDASYDIYLREVETVETTEYKDEATGMIKRISSSTKNDVPYFTDGKTCYVKVGVTVEGTEYIEYLPVMDNRNNAVPLAAITMTLVNKSIQRAFVKACARHGLGLYIYAGEDLPESEKKSAPTIDFEKISKEVNSNCIVNFDESLALVIKKVQEMNYDAKTTDKITAYITSVLPSGKRISMLDKNDPKDVEALGKMLDFITKVEAAYNN